MSQAHLFFQIMNCTVASRDKVTLTNDIFVNPGSNEVDWKIWSIIRLAVLFCASECVRGECTLWTDRWHANTLQKKSKHKDNSSLLTSLRRPVAQVEHNPVKRRMKGQLAHRSMCRQRMWDISQVSTYEGDQLSSGRTPPHSPTGKFRDVRRPQDLLRLHGITFAFLRVISFCHALNKIVTRHFASLSVASKVIGVVRRW